MHALLSLALLAALAAARQDGPQPASPAPVAGGYADVPITVVLLDDIGWELLADAATPNLDALAARGVTFTRAWAYAACSPTRAALLTGRHAFRTGVGRVVRGQRGERGLALEETTLAEFLPGRADAFGKWHVATGATNPNDQGFNHYAGSLGNLDGPGSHGYFRWAKTVDGETTTVTTYATDDTTDEALRSDAPFRYVAYHAAHRPLEWPPGAGPPPGIDGEAPRRGGQRAMVLAMIERLDEQLGRLLAATDGVVFVLSDNGSEATFGGSKGALDEDGVRVPFFVAGPGIAPAVRDDLVSVVDVFATVAEMRGLPVPAGVAEDSISFLPVLRGEPGPRDVVYVERTERGDGGTERAIASRTLRLHIDASGHESLTRMPEDKAVLRPWSEVDAAAAAELRARLPY